MGARSAPFELIAPILDPPGGAGKQAAMIGDLTPAPVD
jgi:hypothetical protein